MPRVQSPALASPFAARQDEHYNGLARFLHWAVVALVVVQYATKFAPVGSFGVFTEQRLDAWHLGIGPTILAVMLVRLAWRLTHPAPPPPADLSTPLQVVSRVTHWLFYLVLLLLPVLGWIAASAFGATSYLLGLIPLPALVAKNDAFAKEVGSVHGTLAWILLAIIALHIAGAAYHGLIKKDGVVGRMLPVIR